MLTLVPGPAAKTSMPLCSQAPSGEFERFWVTNNADVGTTGTLTVLRDPLDGGLRINKKNDNFLVKWRGFPLFILVSVI